MATLLLKHNWILSVSVVLMVIIGCSQYDDGLIKHAVTGSVHVNGAPGPGVMVAFKNLDPSVTGNAAEPVAVTDQEGRFELSTNGAQDGAIEGEYAVAFFWQDQAGAVDFLRGKYGNFQKSTFRVQVGSEDQEIPPFELTAKPDDVKAAMADLTTRKRSAK